MYKFILIEGLDRTGKSTIVKKIAEKLNAVILNAPPDALIDFRTYFDSLDDVSNFNYYLVGNQIQDFELMNLLNSTNVVCDRYYYTTIAYHWVKLQKDLRFILDKINIFPDKIYYLTGDVEELNYRSIKSNSSSNRFHGVELWQEVSKYYDLIFENDYRVVKIDTTNLTPEETLQFILNDLGLH